MRCDCRNCETGTEAPCADHIFRLGRVREYSFLAEGRLAGFDISESSATQAVLQIGVLAGTDCVLAGWTEWRALRLFACDGVGYNRTFGAKDLETVPSGWIACFFDAVVAEMTTGLCWRSQLSAMKRRR